MKRRDIVVAAVILAVAAFVVFRVTRDEPDLTLGPTSSPSLEEDIEGIFNTDIPDGAQKAELVATGDIEGSAIATLEEDKGRNLVTILADLPDPESGTYQAWLVKGERDGFSDTIPLGSMRPAKGGWILDPTPVGEVEGFDKVIVSLERDIDSSLETVVLEGSF